MKVLKTTSKLLKDSDLKHNPVVVRVLKFDDDAAKKFQEDVSDAHNTGQPVIPVVINSPGGSVYALLSMVDTIKSASLPVATIADGKAMSCGAVLLTCGSPGYRFATPNTTILVHDVSSWPGGKIEEIKANTKEAARLDDTVFRLMSQNAGKPDDYFKKMVHRAGHADVFLTAAEAKKHGMIDHIRSPTMRVNIYVDIDFE